MTIKALTNHGIRSKPAKKGDPMKIRVCIAFMLVTLTAAAGMASDRLVVLTEDWPPYNYEENGKIVGMSTEIVQAMLNETGINYQIRMQPWKRAYNTVLTTANTLLYTTSRTESRENRFNWIGPLFPRKTILYKLEKRKDINVSSFQDLNRYRIGVLNGGSVYDHLVSKGMRAKHNLSVVNKPKQYIDLLFYGRVDLIPGDDTELPFVLKHTTYQFSALQQAFTLLDQGGYYIAVNKDTPSDIVKKLESGFQRVVDAGFRENMVKKYLGP